MPDLGYMITHKKYKTPGRVVYVTQPEDFDTPSSDPEFYLVHIQDKDVRGPLATAVWKHISTKWWDRIPGVLRQFLHMRDSYFIWLIKDQFTVGEYKPFRSKKRGEKTQHYNLCQKIWELDNKFKERHNDKAGNLPVQDEQPECEEACEPTW